MQSEPAATRRSLFMPITLRGGRGLIRVGIVPFQILPEIVVWRNRVFIPVSPDVIQRNQVLTPAPDETEFWETTFALAECEGGDAVMVRLQTSGGEFVANAMVPKSDLLPGVVRWGDRIFRLKMQPGDIYNEAFFAMAHNLETGKPEVFAVAPEG